MKNWNQASVCPEWFTSRSIFILLLFRTPVLAISNSDHKYNPDQLDKLTTYEALYDYTYFDTLRNKSISVTTKHGVYGNGKGIEIANAHGVVTVVRVVDGCTRCLNITEPTVPWVALIADDAGECAVQDAIEEAKTNNASAVVTYDEMKEKDTNTIIKRSVEGIVVISIPHVDAMNLIKLVDKEGYNVSMYIRVGGILESQDGFRENPSKTLVALVVSVTVLTMLLLMLTVELLKRCRDAQTKESKPTGDMKMERRGLCEDKMAVCDIKIFINDADEPV